METPTNSSIDSGRATVKDFFINLGVIVSLYVVVISLLNLLFTVINTAYPQIANGYGYYGSQSISWPVATLIIMFPVFVLLSWFLEKGFIAEPEKRYVFVRRWLSYITLFVAGIILAGDLITVLYYFLDGQELTAGFLLKVLAVFVVTLAVFLYYISDLRGKLTLSARKIWLAFSVAVTLASVIWGFAVLGSPATQRLYKYDEQKVSDLQSMNYTIQNYYQTKNYLPKILADLTNTDNYFIAPVDQQSGKPYEYKKTGDKTYELCAEFNKASNDRNKNRYPTTWAHPAGRYCFSQAIDSLQSPKAFPMY